MLWNFDVFVNISRIQSCIRTDQDKVQSSAKFDWLNYFAATCAPCGRPFEKESDVAANLGGDSLQLFIAEPEFPQSIETNQRGSGIA